MGKKREHTLTHNETLHFLVQPLCEQEHMRLRDEVQSGGHLRAIHIWRRHILVDYELYEVYREMRLIFPVRKIVGNSIEDAIIWICRNQLQRTELTDEMRRYLIGKYYLTELLLGMHQAAAQNYDGTTGQASLRLAKDYRIHPTTVQKYGIYTRIIDRIYAVSAEAAARILRGAVKISQDNLIRSEQLSESDFRRFVNMLAGDAAIRCISINEMLARCGVLPEQKSNFVPECMIKQTPDYDPDAGIASMTLTIPSWISAINRVMRESDLSQVTTQANEQFAEMLDQLSAAVRNTIAAVREDGNGRL